MQPLFKFVVGTSIPIPWLSQNDDGSPIVADGTAYFDLSQAAAKSLISEHDLREMWRLTFAQFTGDVLDAEHDRPADSDVIRMREAFIDRAFTGLTPEQREDCEAQIAALGYDLVAGECWATTVENADGERAVIVAKLEALQRRVSASGLFAGRKGFVEFQAFEGPWMHVWNDPIRPPFACRMSICRHGLDHPQDFVGLWSEHAGDSTFWQKQPTFMLEKCTEAKALRKVFRDIVGSVYIPEELPSKRRPSGPKPVEYASDAEMPSVQVVRTESQARAEMTRIGVVHAVVQDKLIAEFRRVYGTFEDDNPEGFWPLVMEKASKIMGRKRGAR